VHGKHTQGKPKHHAQSGKACLSVPHLEVSALHQQLALARKELTRLRTEISQERDETEQQRVKKNKERAKRKVAESMLERLSLPPCDRHKTKKKECPWCQFGSK
jgi:hypothetical protein